MPQTEEKLSGIVDRITFHNPENGWSVLKVSVFGIKHPKPVSVVVHQGKVFAGATMDFYGHWQTHEKYGDQFKAERADERKPASAAALEKYLGSGLIKGVGPKIAQRIVRFFGKDTLDVFENTPERLLEVSGIAQKKLEQIREAWTEHQHVREVMMFLQAHQVSTLFAAKIYKQYGNQAIEKVTQNPYQLAQDIYGIGFISADRIALSIGLEKNSPERFLAGVDHVLNQARESGHCYLLEKQIEGECLKLLNLNPDQAPGVKTALQSLMLRDEIKSRPVKDGEENVVTAYYAKALYFDEVEVAERVLELASLSEPGDQSKIQAWLAQFQEQASIKLSDEQAQAVLLIDQQKVSILTGGPAAEKRPPPAPSLPYKRHKRKRSPSPPQPAARPSE